MVRRVGQGECRAGRAQGGTTGAGECEAIKVQSESQTRYSRTWQDGVKSYGAVSAGQDSGVQQERRVGSLRAWRVQGGKSAGRESAG